MMATGPGFLVGGETKAKLEELVRAIPGSTNGGGQTARPIARGFNGCAVTSSSPNAANLPTGFAWTSISWPGETFDTHSYHSPSTNPTRLTAPSNGYYLFGAKGNFAGMSGGTSVGLRFNHSADGAVITSIFATATTVNLWVSYLYYMDAGEYLEVQAAQNDPGFAFSQQMGLADAWIARLG